MEDRGYERYNCESWEEKKDKQGCLYLSGTAGDNSQLTVRVVAVEVLFLIIQKMIN